MVVASPGRARGLESLRMTGASLRRAQLRLRHSAVCRLASAADPAFASRQLVDAVFDFLELVGNLACVGPVRVAYLVHRAPIREPGAIHCGKQTCRAGSEMCCEYGSGNWCAKLPPGPDPLGLRTGSLFPHGVDVLDKACAPPPSTQAFEYATCDDSADCPSGQRCCTQFGRGGGELSWSVCIPIGDKKETCDSEPCRKGTCRGPLKHCSWWQGMRVCVARPAHMRCGRKRCSSRKWACEVSGKTQRCVAPGPGQLPEDSALFECLRPKDCPKGTMCCESMAGGSRCTEFCDPCMSGLACETNTDCPSPDCGTTSRCVADHHPPGLKTCSRP